jgi:hypothetical protein
MKQSLLFYNPQHILCIFIYFRLIFGSCGTYQYRLQGPNSWQGAYDTVKKVPLTEMMHYTGILLVILAGLVLYYFYVKGTFN